MKYRIFISSVQREFATERKLLADYIRKDAILCKFFEVFLFEKVGSGTGDMLEKCRAAGTPAPRWIEEDDGFTVILKKRDFISIPVTMEKAGMKTGVETAEKGGLKSSLELSGKPPESPQESTLKTLLKSTLNKTDRKVVESIAANPKITITELQKVVGLTRDGVNKSVKRLKQHQVIRRIGPDKGGHWEVLA